MSVEFDIENFPQLSTDQLESYIVSEIIPRMNERRGKNENLTGKKIAEKLNRSPNTEKPGEKIEFAEETRRKILGLDGKIAGEIADLTYYTSNPNCPPEEKEGVHLWLLLIGIPIKFALESCIIKYTVRLKHGDEKDHKEIEIAALERYINETYPNLKNIWQNPDPLTPQSKSVAILGLLQLPK